MRTDPAPNWLRPSTRWRDALQTAAIFFAAFAGLHVLMWTFSLEPFAWTEVLQAAALGLFAGGLRRAAPPVKRRLRAVAPEQLRVTLSALVITILFVALFGIMSIGEPGSLLEGWPLWLGLSLVFGFVLAVVGAAEKRTGDRMEAR
jgi:sterol desaturase/sphingolipid hydroxylase (fatty acid hydroxylase superfamily)